MSCILSIIGENLDVDAFVLKSSLAPYKRFYKGEPRIGTKPEGKKHTLSGLAIQTSSADFHELSVQIKDTITFLQSNKLKLQHIRATKEVQHATLDFAIELRIDHKKVVFQFERFPADLLLLAGELGIDLEVSIYPTSSTED